MTPEEFTVWEAAKMGDTFAIAKIFEQYGQDHALSKVLKEIIEASRTEQNPKLGEFALISEEQATDDLNRGWRFVVLLPSGQLLIQYEGEKQ